MPYAYITLAQARAQLAERLEDPNLVFWNATELNQYLVESIRVWQALTAYYKERVTLTSSTGIPFYDLTSVTLSVSNAFNYNYQAADLVSEICAHLLEPQFNSGSGTGIQFTLFDVVTAVNQRINRFLGDTGCVLTHSTQATGSSPVERVLLADTVIDVRRVAWISSVYGIPITLWRDDQWAMDAYSPSRIQTPTDPPISWAQFTDPPVTVDLAPSAANTGTLDLLTVSSGPTLSTTPSVFYGGTFFLGVPDDLAWAVKWGAISDLLSLDGQNPDPARAQYAEQRYQSAVQLASIHPSVMTARIANVPVPVESTFTLDSYMSSWQATTPSTPQVIGMAGRNILALAPPPSSIGFTVTLDLVSNVPVPASDSDDIQVGRDAIDPIIDYAQHLAMFKIGGSEFVASVKLYKNLLALAAVQNARLKQLAFFKTALLQPATKLGMEVQRV